MENILNVTKHCMRFSTSCLQHTHFNNTTLSLQKNKCKVEKPKNVITVLQQPKVLSSKTISICALWRLGLTGGWVWWLIYLTICKHAAIVTCQTILNHRQSHHFEKLLLNIPKNPMHTKIQMNMDFIRDHMNTSKLHKEEKKIHKPVWFFHQLHDQMWIVVTLAGQAK